MAYAYIIFRSNKNFIRPLLVRIFCSALPFWLQRIRTSLMMDFFALKAAELSGNPYRMGVRVLFFIHE
ncbi:MAG: hypothetical protein ACOC30_00825 [Marinilabilia sp.]